MTASVTAPAVDTGPVIIVEEVIQREKSILLENYPEPVAATPVRKTATPPPESDYDRIQQLAKKMASPSATGGKLSAKKKATTSRPSKSLAAHIRKTAEAEEKTVANPAASLSTPDDLKPPERSITVTNKFDSPSAAQSPASIRKTADRRGISGTTTDENKLSVPDTDLEKIATARAVGTPRAAVKRSVGKLIE